MTIMATKRSKPKLKLYQVRVMRLGRVVYSSQTESEQVARARCKRETKSREVGAIGTVSRVNRKANNTFVPIYEARCVHRGKRGAKALVAEDHETPPQTPPQLPEQ